VSVIVVVGASVATSVTVRKFKNKSYRRTFSGRLDPTLRRPGPESVGVRHHIHSHHLALGHLPEGGRNQIFEKLRIQKKKRGVAVGE
jgi:hypothetical protein